MKRESFFKSLATLIVAPKLISKIDWSKAIAKTKPPTNSFFSDLQIIQPHWCKELLEKYSDADYLTIMEAIGSEGKSTPFKFHYMNTKTGEMLISDEPISATIIL